MTEVQEVDEVEAGVDRRKFLTQAGFAIGGLAAGGAILAACGGDDDGGTGTAAATTVKPVELSSDLPDIEWEMGTSWPTALVTIFGSAQVFSDAVSRLTGGKFKINPRPAGEIVAGGQVLPTVR